MALFGRWAKEQPGTEGVRDHAATHLQIVAHADDDLYFMNPDLLQSIRAGVDVVTVYLTAGEADGRNAGTDDPNRLDAPVDFEGYVAARYRGIRDAYAAMVTGEPRNPGEHSEPREHSEHSEHSEHGASWTRREVRLACGVRVELATLDAAPRVRLYFFNLRREAGERTRRLRTLWNGDVDTQPTLCPTGSPVTQVQRLTRKALLASLAELLDRHRPGYVRIMDLDPDHVSYEAGRGAEYCDNEDHTAAALFAQAALARHGSPTLVVQSYRGYWNKLWPHNLSARTFALKKAYLDVYGRADRQLGLRSYNRGYGQSTTYRFAGSTRWVRLGADRRLQAFAVLGGRPVTWRETAPGSGAWAGPEPLGEASLAPQLTVACGGDGRLYLAAMRLGIAAGEREHRRDIILAEQGPDGSFGAWQELGNPYNATGYHPIKRREVGAPALGVAADGHMRLFVRNFGSGLCSRARPAGGDWQDWEDLRGTCQDGIAPVTTDDGRIEAYAATKSGVLRWYESVPGGPVERDYSLPFPAPASPPTVVRRLDGRLLMVVRQPSTGWVLTYRQAKPDGDWDPQPELAGGHGGFGRVAALPLPDGELVALATRNDDGTVGVSWQPADDRPASTAWLSTGPLFAHAPALAVDALGHLVVAVLGLDGALHVATSTRPGTLGDWTRW